MHTFKIAAAQSASVKGDIAGNIVTHRKYIQAAHEHGMDVIVFPELSLTGYEPEIAKEKALTGEEGILLPLIKDAEDHNMIIMAGCPIISEGDKPYIGEFIIQPSGTINIYRKRFLHSTEVEYFIASDDMVTFSWKGETIGAAICADISNPVHPADAKKMGATIYAAGVLMDVDSIDRKYEILPKYASQYRMLVLMANYAEDSGGYITPGKSGIWDEKGRLVIAAEGKEKAILIAEKDADSWKGKSVNIEI